ncbi:Mediator of RNA polymerase II transcription subunit 18 [Wickerhamomyces ciferrii]|uniref:Mediator of RNA polymerase II transcription subunit 18 n=1 Tax=Wickerhamomyces ciferrii (strain ATCC 14091 / BCRC 22168 / CBS 111 / JCM 3599 / NBRC 0793 / NRRL Y-1031 F-60-10) TaxID=1206466 RepID=K0KJM4_WICCF|nr:Mediator of RNA polymerase II transcription subunit 18 [Wickerhamomyces ciferrii]CCH43171.1 Mediator of RNA polymerase II transcription subunit 18 [Wickerhamomyces ciferrii]
MVQQLSLFSSISKSQYELTKTSIETLTGFKSLTYQNINLISSPKIITKYEPNSKNAQYEQYKINLKAPFKPELHRNDYKDWILSIMDIPSAGKRKINTQSILESNIQILDKESNIDKYLDDLGYKVDTEYVIKGERFFYVNNITIEIFQILVKTETTQETEVKEKGDWEPIDPNFYIIKAFINVEKATDIENLQKSSNHLLNLKNELTGLVELDISDRNSMDSRIGLRK